MSGFWEAIAVVLLAEDVRVVVLVAARAGTFFFSTAIISSAIDSV